MSYTTALVILPNAEQQEAINKIRSGKDKAFPRWMPHINLLYPFVPLEKFNETATTIKTVVTGFGSFTVDLDQVANFKNGKNMVTYHLRPSDSSKKDIVDLQKDIADAIKFNNKKQFNPHLTLGQCSKDDFDSEKQDAEQLGTVSFQVNKVYMIARSDTEDTPYQIVKEISIL